MPVDPTLLTALQHGDSLFPSGASSFSWGLEPLHRDGLIKTATDVAAFIRSQLHGRWQPFDRPVLCAAHAATDDPDSWDELDRIVERMTMPAELRDGSRRAGAAMLAIHARLGTSGASRFYEQVRSGALLGHLAVVQGVVWRGIGLDALAASTVSAHGLVTGMLSAALRLNLIGHATAQTIRGEIQGDIVDALNDAVRTVDDLASFTPLAEIAAMRHPGQQLRLFAT